jgi:DNA-binding NarL/FixJ family response regulator
MSSGGPVRAPDAGGGRTIRVVLADDSYLVRQALVHVLSAADGIDVVATCEDRDSLLEAVEMEQPDVVVTDIRMPPTGTDEGLQVATALRQTHPDIGGVVLSQFAEPRYGVALLDGGSDRRAYLLKDRIQHGGQLVSAITTVAQGGSLIDAKVVDAARFTRRRRGVAAGRADATGAGDPDPRRPRLQQPGDRGRARAHQAGGREAD